MIWELIPKGTLKKRPIEIKVQVTQHVEDELWYLHWHSQKGGFYVNEGCTREVAEAGLIWLITEHLPPFGLPIKIKVMPVDEGWMWCEGKPQDFKFPQREFATQAEARAAIKAAVRGLQH